MNLKHILAFVEYRGTVTHDKKVGLIYHEYSVWKWKRGMVKVRKYWTGATLNAALEMGVLDIAPWVNQAFDRSIFYITRYKKE